MAPAAHAVQQLAITRRWGSWFHPPQLGQDAAAGREKGRMREEGWYGITVREEGRKKKSNMEAPERRDCSWRHEGGQLDERNDALLLLETKPTTL